MITMDKKIALQLAALYRRHAAVVNLIEALEEYASQPHVSPEALETMTPQGPTPCQAA